MSDPVNTSQPIRLGVIGTGLAVERLHWPALRRLTKQFEIVAFANHTRPKAEHFAGYAGLAMDDYAVDYHDLLRRDDVEAVLISLPIPLNLPVTRDALAAGKHVICEKPAGVDDAEGRRFIELERQYPDRIVLITENSFYRDDARLARSLIDRGALGAIHLVCWRTVQQLVPREGQFSSTPWRHDPGYAGGPHLDAGVHHTALLRLLCGDVERVYGETQDANSTHGGPSDLTLALRFVNGAVGNYTAAYPELEVPREANELRLYGTEGVMTLGRGQVRVDRPGEPAQAYRTKQEDFGHYNAFVNFHEAVRHGAPVLGTVTQTFRNMQIVLDGLAAARSGQSVAIDPYPSALSATPLALWSSLQPDPLFADPDWVECLPVGQED
jgi:predicted dehydrogenase